MENWIEIISFTYPHEAHMAKALLESEGLVTLMKDEMTAQVNNVYSNAIGGVKILVRESDYEKGIVILQKGGYVVHNMLNDQSAIEDVRIDPLIDKSVCPFCKSSNIVKDRDPNILTAFVFFILGAFSPIFKTSYKCFECGKKWRFLKK